VDVVISVTVGRTCKALCGEEVGVTHSSRCFYGEVREKVMLLEIGACAALRY